MQDYFKNYSFLGNNYTGYQHILSKKIMSISILKTVLFRVGIVYFLLLSVLGCDPIFVERQRGDLLIEGKTEAHGIIILTQLYQVARYGAERDLVYWCKSKNTETLQTQTQKEWGNPIHKMKIDGNGWLNFSGASSGDVNNKNSVLKRLPTEKIHIVDDNFTYIEHGYLVLSMTFDGCKTVINMPPYKFYDEYSDNKDQLFKKDELIVRQAQNFEGLGPTFILGFNRQAIKEIDQICFNVNPIYIKDPNQSFQVCTVDKGANWFATRKIGDGKVMKRLAGSEEWIDYAI
jgi:hypothetical protein